MYTVVDTEGGREGGRGEGGGREGGGRTEEGGRREEGGRGRRMEGVSIYMHVYIVSTCALQALSDARQQLKFLLVYLHSPHHQDTPHFCR